MKIRRAYVAGFGAFIITLIVAHGRSTPYNNFVLLADAFLHGHAWIDWPGDYIDALAFGGRHYVIEAPLPAILLFPLVVIWGTAANQTLLAVALAGISIGAAWELCERYGVPAIPAAWLCAFLLAGTDLLWCAMLGDVWFVSHVSAVCFSLLALVELAGKRRGWAVALWAVCAIESRLSMIAALPAYVYLLAGDPHRPLRLDVRWLAGIRGFAAVAIPCIGLWTWYNFSRWGLWYDIGYTAWYHQDAMGLPSGSPFRLAYVPYQMQSFFVQTPTVLHGFPWLRPELSGVALTWTSPALLLAFLARTPARWTIALWSAAILVAIPSFLYYVNGFAQFGMRHALDFEPFLFALMALGVRAPTRIPAWGYALIAYSCAAGVWGCWYWNGFIVAGR